MIKKIVIGVKYQNVKNGSGEIMCENKDCFEDCLNPCWNRDGKIIVLNLEDTMRRWDQVNKE